MRFTPTALVPPTGRRRGIVTNVLAGNSTARAAIVPVQPKTNAQAYATQGVANVAAFWASLSLLEQEAWEVGLPDFASAYAYFVAVNAPLILWGLPLFDAPPAFTVGPGVTFVSLYSDPNGVNTQLVTIASGTPLPGLEVWLRMYISWKRTSYGTTDSSTAAVFVGSYGPVNHLAVSVFDFTAEQTANVGQWWYPGNVDTASETICGNRAVTAFYYVTDQFGRVYLTGGDNPTFDQAVNYAPLIVAPGVCPPLTSPPYPWPDAATWFA